MTKAVKTYIIKCENFMTGKINTTNPLTLAEAVIYYSYTLSAGSSYSYEKGNKVINRNPSTIKSLISNLTNASNNSAANGFGKQYSATEVLITN